MTAAERQAVRRAALEAAASEIRRRLAYNDQRAVSWHEVEDCAVAVTNLADEPAEPLDDADYVHPGTGRLLRSKRVKP